MTQKRIPKTVETCPTRFEVTRGLNLSITVWSVFRLYQNEYFEFKWWHCLEEWFILIGLNPSIFNLEDCYYDGHKYKGITILGLTFGYGYTYLAKELEDQKSDSSPPPNTFSQVFFPFHLGPPDKCRTLPSKVSLSISSYQSSHPSTTTTQNIRTAPS